MVNLRKVVDRYFQDRGYCRELVMQVFGETDESLTKLEIVKGVIRKVDSEADLGRVHFLYDLNNTPYRQIAGLVNSVVDSLEKDGNIESFSERYYFKRQSSS